MSIVIDSSVAVAALIDTGARGVWSMDRLQLRPLFAPHIVTAEATNILRRAALAGKVTQEVAALAHRDLLDLPFELYPFSPFAERIWDLRDTVTAYDAWYVALAETIGTSLATLDMRLANAPGPTCRFETPPL